MYYGHLSVDSLDEFIRYLKVALTGLLPSSATNSPMIRILTATHSCST